MTAEALALVLAAALMHAVWNALAKRAHDQLVFLWSSVALATLALAPGILFVTGGSGPSWAALPFVGATTALHGVYFYALARAYRAGDFSMVYPIARGLGVGLVPLGAYAVLDERLSALGGVGVGLVVTGIVLMGGAGRRTAAAEARRGRAGTAWAVVTGLCIAAYSLVDKVGVTRMHPVPYLVLMGIGMSALLAPAVLRRPGALALEWRQGWRPILAASTMNLTSYLLVLFAFRLSKAGYVVAARELSIVLSVPIGRLWLGERGVGPRLAGAAVILAGVVCIAAVGR